MESSFPYPRIPYWRTMPLLDQYRHIGLLNQDPLVVLSCVDSLAPLQPNLADLLATALRRPFSLILEVWQSWEQLLEDDPESLNAIAGSIRRHLAAHSQNQIWIACNTVPELTIARNLGLDAAFLHHNAFVNETIFEPLPTVEKEFDAIYNAQMWTRKRHELAAKIGSICLVFGMHLGDASKQRL